MDESTVLLIQETQYPNPINKISLLIKEERHWLRKAGTRLLRRSLERVNSPNN
jgi:hypothetical protein